MTSISDEKRANPVKYTNGWNCISNLRDVSENSYRPGDLIEITPRPQADFAKFPRPRAIALGLGNFTKSAFGLGWFPIKISGPNRVFLDYSVCWKSFMPLRNWSNFRKNNKLDANTSISRQFRTARKFREILRVNHISARHFEVLSECGILLQN